MTDNNSDSIGAVTVLAAFSQHRNDMHWKLYDPQDGYIRWGGYDDSNWWDNVSPTDAARNRVGKLTGRIYRIDHETNEVEIIDADTTTQPTGEGSQ